MHKTLILSITRMGDLIQSAPFLRRLKIRRPDTEVHLVVEKCFSDVSAMLPDVDVIHALELKDILPQVGSGKPSDLAQAIRNYRRYTDELRQLNADEVWNLTHTKPATVLNHLLAGANGKGVTLDDHGLLLVNIPWLRYFYATNLARPWCQFNLVDIYANAVTGIEWAAGRRLNVEVADESNIPKFTKSGGAPLVAIHPGASHPAKRWPIESFVEVAARLHSEFNAKFVVVGGSADVTLARAFERVPDVASFIGNTTPNQLAAILKQVDLLISNDSGPMHMAAAVGTRVLCLTVGTALASETAPYGEGHVVVEPAETCFPCSPHRPCESSQCARAIDAMSITTIAAGLLRTADRNRPLGPWPNVSFRVYRTHVSEHDSMLSLIPMSPAANDERHQLNELFRDYWLTALEPGRFNHAQLAPLTLRARAAATQALITAQSAMHHSVKLMHIAQTGAGSERECQYLGREIMKCEEGLQRALRNGSPLELVWNYHQICRSSLLGDSLTAQAHETHRHYLWLTQFLTNITTASTAKGITPVVVRGKEHAHEYCH